MNKKDTQFIKITNIFLLSTKSLKRREIFVILINLVCVFFIHIYLNAHKLAFLMHIYIYECVCVCVCVCLWVCVSMYQIGYILIQ